MTGPQAAAGDGVVAARRKPGFSRALAVLIAGAWSWWAWALVAATLGFLPFNYPNARIFLGDVASGTMGFVLAALLG